MERLSDMALFVEVARRKSFSRAAEALAISTSQVSRRIGALEQSIGVALLNRTTRRLELTEAGEVYFQRTSELVDAAAAAHEHLTSFVSQPRGRLRLSTTVEIARLAISEAVALFVERHPAVEVELDLSSRRVDLIADGYDAAIRVGEQPDSGLISRRIGSMRLGLFASPAFLAAHGSIDEPSDLASRPVVRNPSVGEPDVWTLSRDGAHVSVTVSGPVATNNFGVMRQLALRSVGVAGLHEPMVGSDLASGRLVRVLPGWVGGEKPVVLLTPSRLLPAKTRLFIELAGELCAERLA